MFCQQINAEYLVFRRKQLENSSPWSFVFLSLGSTTDWELISGSQRVWASLEQAVQNCITWWQLLKCIVRAWISSNSAGFVEMEWKVWCKTSTVNHGHLTIWGESNSAPNSIQPTSFNLIETDVLLENRFFVQKIYSLSKQQLMLDFFLVKAELMRLYCVPQTSSSAIPLLAQNYCSFLFSFSWFIEETLALKGCSFLFSFSWIFGASGNKIWDPGCYVPFTRSYNPQSSQCDSHLIQHPHHWHCTNYYQLLFCKCALQN